MLSLKRVASSRKVSKESMKSWGGLSRTLITGDAEETLLEVENYQYLGTLAGK